MYYIYDHCSFTVHLTVIRQFKVSGVTPVKYSCTCDFLGTQFFSGSIVRAETKAEYSYKSMWMSTGTDTDVVFEIKSEKDAHILLSTMLNMNTSTGKFILVILVLTLPY